MRTPKYKLKFWFEWSAETPFWSANEFTQVRFEYPVDLDRLPLSTATVERARQIAQWHDSALNWDSPLEPSLWHQNECDRFNLAVKELYERVVQELGEDFEVVNTQEELLEDPELDEYLKNPKYYMRKRDQKSSPNEIEM